MSQVERVLQKWREIAIEAPEDALDPPMPVPFGMVAWKNLRNEFVVVAAHYSADPDKCNDEWYAEACKGLRPDQIERELELNFDSKAGAKAFPFLAHNEDVYRLDPPDPIPPNWKIIIGLDYGARNPTSVGWYAVDPQRRFWCFDEFYKPLNQLEGGIVGLANYLKGHKYYSRARKIVADPNIFNKNQNVLEMKENSNKSYGTLMSIADLLIKQGIHKIQRGNNDRMAGLARLHTLFNFRGDSKTKPFIFFGHKIKKGWWELTNIVHKPDNNESKGADEDVVKRNDHFFDQLKYSALSEDIPAEADLASPSGKQTLDSIEEEIDEEYNKQNNDVFAISCRELDGGWDSLEGY